jgi:hypothetical protein
MSRIETLRNDAAKLLTALYAESTLSNAVALANVANQMIAELSASAVQAKAKSTNIPQRISDFDGDTKLRWANGQWHSLISGTDYAGTTAAIVSMVHNLAKSVDMKAETRTYGQTVRFRINEREVAQ